MKIFYCGERRGNSLSRYEAAIRLGHIAYLFDPNDFLFPLPKIWRSIEWRLRNGIAIKMLNMSFCNAAISTLPDIVWIEKGLLIYHSTILKIKSSTSAFIIGSHSDDFLDEKSNKISRHFDKSIPLYDLIFTPRDINYDELRLRGSKHVAKYWKGFDEYNIKPWSLSNTERSRFSCDVIFVGHCEEFRFRCLKYLADTGINLKIGGGLWNKQWPQGYNSYHIGSTEGADFAKAYCGAKIGLNFLSEWARDTQNSRAFEIPATRTFMLSERSDDLTDCFIEGVEAEFFSSQDELVDKVFYYLKHANERDCIAQKGYEKCIKSGYSNYHRTRSMLDVASKMIGPGLNSTSDNL